MHPYMLCYYDDVMYNHTCTDAASAKKMAKVMFDYDATHVDELTIKVDDVVEVIGDDEPGWYVYV